MEPVAVALAVVVVLLFAGLLVLGARSSRSTADLLDWRPAREDPDEDADQMLEALRRRRPGLTRDEFEADVRRTQEEIDEWRGS